MKNLQHLQLAHADQHRDEEDFLLGEGAMLRKTRETNVHTWEESIRAIGRSAGLVMVAQSHCLTQVRLRTMKTII